MFKSIYSVRLDGTITTAAAPISVNISDVRFWNTVATVGSSTWVLTLEDGATFEIIEASAAGGVLSITKRGLDPSDIKVEVPSNRKQRNPGTLIYLTAAASDLVDLDGPNSMTGSINFDSTTTSQVNLQQLTTAQRNSLTNVRDGSLVYDTDLGAVQGREGGAWTGFGPGATVPNATPLVVGKSKISNTTEFNNGTDITGGAYNVVIPSQVQGYGNKYDRIAFVSPGGDDTTGVVGNPNRPFETIQGGINAASAMAVIVYPGTYTENVILKDDVYVYSFPGVTVTGSVTTGGSGDDYYFLGYADIVNTAGLVIDMTNAADELTLECQSIAVSGGATADAIRISNVVNILVRGSITLDNDGKGINIGNVVSSINGFFTVLGDIIQLNATTSNTVYLDGTNTDNFTLRASTISAANASAVLLHNGRANIFADFISGSTYGVESDSSGIDAYTRIHNATISGSAAAIRNPNGDIICQNCVLLGTNAVSSATAQDIRLYNCVSTNAVDGNTTNLITGGLITDAQVI